MELCDDDGVNVHVMWNWTRDVKSAGDRDERRIRADYDAIGAGLRQLWQSIENEPVPADFLILLDKIDARIGIEQRVADQVQVASVSHDDRR